MSSWVASTVGISPRSAVSAPSAIDQYESPGRTTTVAPSVAGPGSVRTTSPGCSRSGSSWPRSGAFRSRSSIVRATSSASPAGRPSAEARSAAIDQYDSPGRTTCVDPASSGPAAGSSTAGRAGAVGPSAGRRSNHPASNRQAWCQRAPPAGSTCSSRRAHRSSQRPASPRVRSATSRTDSPVSTSAYPDGARRPAARSTGVAGGWTGDAEAIAGARAPGEAEAGDVDDSDETTTRPAAIQLATPSKARGAGMPTWPRPGRDATTAATTDDTSEAHSSQATTSRARSTTGTISSTDSSRSSHDASSSGDPMAGTGFADPKAARAQTTRKAGMPSATAASAASDATKRPQERASGAALTLPPPRRRSRAAPVPPRGPRPCRARGTNAAPGS